jgi:hypothetical protein
MEITIYVYVGTTVMKVPRAFLDLNKLCLRSEYAFVITRVTNLMEIKVLYVQQDLRYEIFSYLRFNV